MKKWIINLIAIFSIISMLSMGFASWVIHTPIEDIPQPEGNFEVDDTVMVSDYLTLTNFDVFNYCQYGYVDKTNTIDDYGYITADFELDLNKCKELYVGLNTIDVVVELGYSSSVTSSYNIFLSNNTSTVTHSLTNSSAAATISTATNQNKKYQVTASFSDVSSIASDTITFSIEYKFNGFYFNNTTYNLLKMSNFGFAINAKIQGR